MARMTEQQKFLHHVRLIQRKTKCSNNVCAEFVRVYHKYINDNKKETLRSFDKKAKNIAGVNFSVLHGCPECNSYVCSPDDTKENCPNCDHPRYNDDGKPWEVMQLFVLLVLLVLPVFLFCLF